MIEGDTERRGCATITAEAERFFLALHLLLESYSVSKRHSRITRESTSTRCARCVVEMAGQQWTETPYI